MQLQPIQLYIVCETHPRHDNYYLIVTNAHSVLLNDICHLLWKFMIYLRCSSAAHCDQSSTTFINYIFINHRLRQDQFFSATTVMLLMYRQVECSVAACCTSSGAHGTAEGSARNHHSPLYSWNLQLVAVTPSSCC